MLENPDNLQEEEEKDKEEEEDNKEDEGNKKKKANVPTKRAKLANSPMMYITPNDAKLVLSSFFSSRFSSNVDVT